MNILFLDDDPNRTETFTANVPSAHTTETAEECISAFDKEEEWSYVLLDHDLGGEVFVKSDREDCGMEVVRWIVENKPKIGQVVVHSFNPDASKEMVLKLRDAGYDAIPVPFYMFDSEKSNIYAVLNGET